MEAKSIIPVLRYRDAQEAIGWLCETWGFKKHLVVDGPDNTVQHAELRLGDVFVMLASNLSEGNYTQFTIHPDETGGKVTQSVYLVVKDPAEFYEAAKTSGIKILLELTAEDYGGSNFTCADPEGHVWNFGSYDPLMQ